MATPKKKEEPQAFTPLVELPKCLKAPASLDPEKYGPMVTITVGSTDKTRKFYAYKGLLAHYSSYFKAALKDDWKEGASNTVKLRGDNPEVFKAFFHWINTGKLYFALDASGKVPLTWKLIYEIYVFGDARGAPDLCNTAIDLLLQKLHQEWQLPLACTTYIYDNTVPGTALRRCLVDCVVEDSRLYSLTDRKTRTHQFLMYRKEFLGDIIVELMAPGPVPTPSITDFTDRASRKANWTKYIKPLICARYHDHSSFPA